MNRFSGHKGLTLIELILVMGMLATLMALAVPRLSNFLTGRSLQEEARRLLSLSEYARSEAVSRSVPMELWVDSESGAYGLAAAEGFEFDEKSPLEFQLSEDLHFDVNEEDLDDSGLATVRFLPDGTIEEGGFESVRIQEDEANILQVARADHGLGYRIDRVEADSAITIAD